VHLRPTGKPEMVSPMIGLYFTGQPRKKFPMLVQLEHDEMIDIPPGDKDFLVTDDVKLPMDVNVLAIYPHAHYLGKLMESYATLQEGLMRQRIEKYPDDFNANYNLGDSLLNKGDAACAIPYFQAACRANPASVVAATELGVALFSARKLDEAADQFRRALILD